MKRAKGRSFAERAKRECRNEKHMIYEMSNFSQYTDGSVLDRHDTEQGRTTGDWLKTYTAQEVADGAVKIVDSNYQPATVTMNDLIRNAQEALDSDA